ncbi:MAG: hypothetical protein JW876_07135 [Candidatus Krumholzibacteriota bacterium]|nr:hypothetical protein [Candidatus Krumholzibacteriota bacterium]
MGFRLLHYLLERRRIVGWATLVFLVFGVAIAALRDPLYETRAILMPPLEEGGEGLLSAWMAQIDLPSMVTPASAGATAAALLSDLLRSRRLSLGIIDEYGLRERYEVETTEDAIEELAARREVSATKTGLIFLVIRDEEPAMAVRIAEAHIAALDSLNRNLVFTRAGQTMRFIALQIDEYRRRLGASRAALADFQSGNGVIDIAEQTRGAIDVAATLHVEAALARIRLDMGREFATDDASELHRLEARYRFLVERIDAIVEGDSTAAVFPPLRDMPGLAQRAAALERDVEVNERIYSFLLQRYEEAGIERARTTPSIQTVEAPILPEEPAGLPRWVFALVFALGGGLWVGLILLWWGWIVLREKNAAETAAMERIGRLAREDLDAVRRRLRI